MCVGGGGGSGAFFDNGQYEMQQQQLVVQQQIAAQQLAEQQREFDIQQQQAQQTLANTQALQAKQQAEADQQAALTEQWQTGRAQEQAQGTAAIDKAFASFTPDYYNQYTKDYLAHYQPQIDQQYGQASNNVLFGLARSGNLQSQTAADQIQDLSRQKGQVEADINNQAIQSTENLRQNVINSKSNLMGQVTSDATLGSPITPGSADAISANFANTSAALSRLQNSAGDVVTTLQATPAYSSLGSLFGSLAGSTGSALSGNQTYNNYQAFQQLAGASGLGSSSGRVS